MIIILLGLSCCGTGLSYFIVADISILAIRNDLVIQFIPFMLVPELIEFLYYLSFGKRERDLGPRKDTRSNIMIFASFVVAIIVTLIIGLARLYIMLWPMYIYVVFGNALETALLFQYKVNDQRNWTLTTSKAVMTAANIVLINAGDHYYDLKMEGMLRVFTCLFGVLYVIHGITLSLGLFKYYSYPIISQA